MLTEIRARADGRVLYTIEWGSGGKLDLQGLDLSEASLSGCNLKGANLSRTDLRGTYLFCLELAEANLTEALLPEGLPRLKKPATQILAMLRGAGELLMSDWHGKRHDFCGTTHCLAGWVTSLCGPEGERCEQEFGYSTAAALILANSGCPIIPDFYSSEEVALKWLEEQAKREQDGGAVPGRGYSDWERW